MGHHFTQRQCIQALLKIGFTDVSTRRSKHLKYSPSGNSIINVGPNMRPFITIPKHDFYCQDAIVREIDRLCGEEMKQRFLDNL